MAVIYARRITQGLMVLEDVPEKWREEVKALIGGDAYE